MVQDATVLTILGTGQLKVSTAGATGFVGRGGSLLFYPVLAEEANKMSELIIKLRNERRSAPMPAATPQPAKESEPPGPADRLRELERLHSEGLLGYGEYSAKRAQILENL